MNLKVNIYFFMASIFSFLFLSIKAIAEELPIPEGNIAELLIELATNYSTLGTLGIISILTIVSVQVVRQYFPEWKYKRLTVVFMSILYAIASGLMIDGSSTVSVIMTVLISSGGAMALYDALKGAGIIKKK